MPVTDIKVDNAQATFDSDGGRKVRVGFKMKASKPPVGSGNDTEAVVLAAFMAATGYIPGTPYPALAAAICQSISVTSVKRIDNPDASKVFWQWIGAADFSSKPNQENPTNQPNPVLRLPKVSCDIEVFETPARDALSDPFNDETLTEPIQNSAGDPIIRMKKRARVNFRWQRFMPEWEWRFNREWPRGFLFSRNAAMWNPVGPWTDTLGNQNIAAGCARIEKLTSSLHFENGGACADVQCEIKTDDNAFADQFLDAGFFHLQDTYLGNGRLVTNRVRFTDRNGFCMQPQLLDGHGRALVPPPNPVKPVTLEAQLYGIKDWSKYPFGGAGGLFS